MLKFYNTLCKVTDDKQTDKQETKSKHGVEQQDEIKVFIVID